MNPPPEDASEPEETENTQLNEVLEFYDCAEYLPYVQHIFWLSNVKEAVGRIPFNLEYEDIRCLVILQEEIGKKSTKQSQEMSKKGKSPE